jgi:hypothetical protein
MALPSPPPPRSPVEPTPAFGAVLDLPIRYRISPGLSDKVSALGAAARAAPDAWPAHYEAAIGLVDACIAELSSSAEAIQARLGAADDPNELKQRLAAGPRRDADRALADAKASLAKAHREATERLRRQAQHVREQCVGQVGGSLAIVVRNTTDGIHVTADPAWWGQFTGYITRCCDEWSLQFSEAHEPGFAASFSSLVAVGPARGAAPVSPAASPPSLARPALSEPPGGKEVEVPSHGAALGGYLRSHLMSIGIVSSVVMAGVALVPGGTGAVTTAIRGLILLAFLPLLSVFAWRGAAQQRDRLRRKAVADQREATAKAIVDTVERQVEAHRVTLERWSQRRVDDWGAAADRWMVDVVQPNLAELDAVAAEQARLARVAQGQLTEELGALKAARTQLSQNLLVDLKRRLRQLQEA